MKKIFTQFLFWTPLIVLIYFWSRDQSGNFIGHVEGPQKVELEHLVNELPDFMYDTVLVEGRVTESFYVPMLKSGYLLESPATGTKIWVRSTGYPEQEGKYIVVKVVVKPGIKALGLEAVYLREIEHYSRPKPRRFPIL
jgi:hypothetical protein